ncbi:MAG: aminodeoxychorismate/anthranilate synthase component II [Pseudomonadota bacterium]
MKPDHRHCLLIDNYDSFTFNLYHLIGTIGQDCLVRRNDKITLNEIKTIKPYAIILSPGPCTPIEAGLCLDIINRFYKHIPIFGVCLGMQAIAMNFGAKLIHQNPPMHGKISLIQHHDQKLFKDIPQQFKATRYHSLCLNPQTISTQLEVTATGSDDDVIMAIRHQKHCVYGVQFHPESVASQFGIKILANFFDLASVWNKLKKNHDENKNNS